MSHNGEVGTATRESPDRSGRCRCGWLGLAPIVILLLGTGTTTGQRAQEAGRSFPYPADALLVGTIKGLQPLQERLAEFAKAVSPMMAARWQQQLLRRLEPLVKQRDWRVVRSDERLFVVVHDLGEDFSHPSWSLLLPVQGYKEFCTSFLTAEERRSRSREGEGIEAIRTAALGGEEETLYLVDVGGYVAICSEQRVAERYAVKYQRGSTGVMGPALTAAFLDADVAVYVNMEAVLDRYGKELRAIKGVLDFLLRQADQEIPGLDASQRELQKKMLSGMFQAVEDSRAAVVAAGLSGRGLEVQVHIRFEENTVSSKALAREGAIAEADWGRLPAGLPLYFAYSAQGVSGELLEMGLLSFTAGANDPQGQRLLALHMDDLRSAGLQAQLGGIGFPYAGLTVLRYRQPEKAARAWVKVYKVLGPGSQAGGFPLKAAPRVREAAEQYRGFSFTEVRLQYDFDALLEDVAEPLREPSRTFLQRLIPERQTLWIGLVEKEQQKEVIHLSGRDWDSVRPLLDAYLNGQKTLASQPAIAAVRSRLGDHSNGLLIDLNDVIPLLNELFVLIALENEQPPPPKLKLQRGARPAWLTLAYFCKDDVFSFRLHCSSEAAGLVVQLAELLAKEFD